MGIAFKQQHMLHLHNSCSPAAQRQLGEGFLQPLHLRANPCPCFPLLIAMKCSLNWHLKKRRKKIPLPFSFPVVVLVPSCWFQCQPASPAPHPLAALVALRWQLAATTIQFVAPPEWGAFIHGGAQHQFSSASILWPARA